MYEGDYKAAFVKLFQCLHQIIKYILNYVKELHDSVFQILFHI